MRPPPQVAHTQNTVKLHTELNAAALGSAATTGGGAEGGGGGGAMDSDDMFEAAEEDLVAFEEGVVWVGPGKFVGA